MGLYNVAARRPLFQEHSGQGGGGPVSSFMCSEGGGTEQHVVPDVSMRPVPVSAPMTKRRRSGHRCYRTPREEVGGPKLFISRKRPRMRGA